MASTGITLANKVEWLGTRNKGGQIAFHCARLTATDSIYGPVMVILVEEPGQECYGMLFRRTRY
jgi:hypothetical protein